MLLRNADIVLRSRAIDARCSTQAFKLNHSGAKVVVVGDKSKFDKVVEIIEGTPKVQVIVCYDYEGR
jgi:hypothetical protein